MMTTQRAVGLEMPMYLPADDINDDNAKSSRFRDASVPTDDINDDKV